MSVIWKQFRILLVVCLPLVSMMMSGCPGPGQSLFGTCSTTCTDCNPKTTFPGGVVTLPNGSYKLFDKGRAEYGCIGVRWAGQKNNPPAFAAKLKSDGTYETFDPATRTFVSENAIANVAAGVGQVDAFFVLLKTTEKEIIQLDCANLIKGGAKACSLNENCLFSWKVEKTTAAGEGGTCKLCRREVCNGKDDDCDGTPDNNGACGALFSRTLGCNASATEKVDASTPGCDPKGACSCIVTPKGTVYVCGGATQGSAKWVQLSSATALCSQKSHVSTTTSKFYYCGGEQLICDICPSITTQPAGWRKVKKGCTDGYMVISK